MRKSHKQALKEVKQCILIGDPKILQEYNLVGHDTWILPIDTLNRKLWSKLYFGKHWKITRNIIRGHHNERCVLGFDKECLDLVFAGKTVVKLEKFNRTYMPKHKDYWGG